MLPGSKVAVKFHRRDSQAPDVPGRKRLVALARGCHVVPMHWPLVQFEKYHSADLCLHSTPGRGIDGGGPVLDTAPAWQTQTGNRHEISAAAAVPQRHRELARVGAIGQPFHLLPDVGHGGVVP